MIRFECSCGKRLKVEDRFAGQTVECTACSKRMRVPAAVAAALPVAEVVEEPEAAPDTADDPLAALAQAAKGNGGAKPGSKTPVRPGAAARGVKPASKAPAGKTSATAELLAKRRVAEPSNKKALYITLGVAAAVILVFIVYLVFQSDNTPPPTGGNGKTVYVITQPPKTATRPSSPGELFPSVAPQTDDGPPAKPEGGK